ncbi:MAG: inorganic phosphate transporter [Ignavibacteriales bacterium]
METYLVLIIILFVLAASDLTIGVANDAVNFLNSAIGSKVAPRHIILIVAAAGVFIGTFFSSGMMEVARKGIFQPGMYTFNEILCIFLAVMFTDVLLLDFYNTFGLPTSTTVSLISSLLGGSTAIALIKISQQGLFLESIGKFINTGKTLGIFTAIVVSVLVSFIVGSTIQYVSRIIFTFNYEKRLKKFGTVWGAIALTSILYFIFIKGAKGASFLTKENISWIYHNTFSLLMLSFLFCALILELLILFTKINILKFIVLMGTFSLALAFAANDLVNFIGVPLAGLSSYQIASSSASPFEITMDGLNNPASANNLILFFAGIIMIITLTVNKKAKSVTQTQIDLSRQFEGFEKFESIRSARDLVRTGIGLGNSIRKIIPEFILNYIDKRFEPREDEFKKAKKEKPAFDLIRASVNLMVASSLISIGTAYKLPLSTTYVTFMVAMATSFADRAWGRESAVYRVSGVLTVIGGWFLTAFIAFLVSGAFASGMYFGGIWATVILSLLAIGIIVRTNLLHSKKEKNLNRIINSLESSENSDIKEFLDNDIKEYFENIKKSSRLVFDGLSDYNRKKLKKAKDTVDEIEKAGHSLTSRIIKITSALPENYFQDKINFGKLIASINEIDSAILTISEKTFEHVDNNHSELTKSVKEQYSLFQNLLEIILELSFNFIKKRDLNKLKIINQNYDELKKMIQKIDKNLIDAIQKGESKPRGNMLLLNIIYKSEKICRYQIELLNFLKLFINRT